MFLDDVLNGLFFGFVDDDVCATERLFPADGAGWNVVTLGVDREGHVFRVSDEDELIFLPVLGKPLGLLFGFTDDGFAKRTVIGRVDQTDQRKGQDCADVGMHHEPRQAAQYQFPVVRMRGAGALGVGDIGKHFPDTDPAYQGASSMLLLEHVLGLARARGFRVGNLDVTVVAEKPKLAPYVGEMTANIARACEVPEERVNVKATTTEGLGFTGRGEGIAAHAVVLMTDDER